MSNPAVVQSAKVNAAVGGTIAFSITPTQGNILIAFTAWDDFGGARTITAPDGTWTQIDSDLQGNDHMASWWYPVPASPASTYTFTISNGTGRRSGVIYEVSGQDPTFPIDQHGTSKTGGATSLATASKTPSVINTLFLSAHGTDANVDITGQTAGWTKDQSATGDFHPTVGCSRTALTTDTSTAITNTATYAGSNIIVSNVVSIRGKATITFS